MKNRETLLALIFALVIVAMRFLPHPVNFSATLALMIYAGHAGRTSKWLWVVTPLLILGSDIALGLYDGISMVYLAYGFALLSGMLIARGKFISYFFSGLISSAVFFGLSNYGVWAYTNMYPKDQMGLLQCYVMALPFFHYTLISTLGGLVVMLGVRFFALKKSLASEYEAKRT